jgi:hypothetical protein
LYELEDRELVDLLVQNQARLNLILSTAGSKTTKAKPASIAAAAKAMVKRSKADRERHKKEIHRHHGQKVGEKSKCGEESWRSEKSRQESREEDEIPGFLPPQNRKPQFGRSLDGQAGTPIYGENLPACGPIPLLYLTHHDPLRPSRMRKPKSFLRVFTDTGPLAVLAVVIALLVGIVGPASAQFFNFGGFGGPPQRQAPQRGGGWFGGDFFQPFQQAPSQQQAPRQDFSRAPGPAKRDTVPERNVLVLGDAMATGSAMAWKTPMPSSPTWA